MKGTHVVYWLESGKPQVRHCFDLNELLKASEELRKMRRNGYTNISHITTHSEYIDRVGEDGVDVTGPDYDWKKRRP